MKKRLLSGMRPTGPLHLGHWVGALNNWAKLQDKYECFFMVADWHAHMSEYEEPKQIRKYTLDNVIDWAEELEMHLILDNHTFDPADDTDPNVGVMSPFGC